MRLPSRVENQAKAKRIVELKMKDRELTHRAIAERVGCSFNTVQVILRDAGLADPRKVGGQKTKGEGL